ncbi:MCA1 [Symbiodinium sp. CCMP2456]|nr:MCA1 [Symbiodinium sp. CCMP2456]
MTAAAASEASGSHIRRLAMGAANDKLASADDRFWHASAKDAPEMWSHVPATYIERVVPEQESLVDLQLPPCKVISHMAQMAADPEHRPGVLRAEARLADSAGSFNVGGTSNAKDLTPVQTSRPIVDTPQVHSQGFEPQSALTQKSEQPSHWTCAKCGEPNKAVREQCNNCNAPRPTGPSATEIDTTTAEPGRKKCLLIGINYYGSQNELHGCVDDVHRMLPVLEQLGFPHAEDDSSCRILLDSPEWRMDRRPTLANIRAGISWLVAGAQAGDTFFLHYSGHGGRMPREDGRGDWHETLCPVDMDEAGMLLDSELFASLVQPLPSGCRLTCILDACHSAGALDLPYIFMGTPENIKKALAGEAVQMAMSKSWLRDFERWEVAEDPTALLADVASMGMGLWDMWRRYKGATSSNQNGFCADEPNNIGRAVGEVIAITGCASDQTSADVGDVHSEFDLKPSQGGGHLRVSRTSAGGALTSAFIEAMDASQGRVTYLNLLEHLRGRLADAGYSQVPQLASSLLLDLKQCFSLATSAQQGSTSTEDAPTWQGQRSGMGGMGGALGGVGAGGCGGGIGNMVGAGLLEAAAGGPWTSHPAQGCYPDSALPNA